MRRTRFATAASTNGNVPMKVDRSDLESNLPKKGFREDQSGDQVFFHHWRGGLETGVFTKVSHSRKLRCISDGLLTQVRKQLHLDTNHQVVDLARCPRFLTTDLWSIISRALWHTPDSAIRWSSQRVRGQVTGPW
jgi:hypothetical protein